MCQLNGLDQFQINFSPHINTNLAGTISVGLNQRQWGGGGANLVAELNFEPKLTLIGGKSTLISDV